MLRNSLVIFTTRQEWNEFDFQQQFLPSHSKSNGFNGTEKCTYFVRTTMFQKNKKTVPFCFLYPVNVMYVSWFLNYSNATVVMSVGRSNVPTTNCPSLLFSINLSFVFRRSLSSSSSKRHSTFGDLNSSKKSIDGEPDSKNEKKHKHHKHSAKKKTKSKHKSKKR